MSKSIDKQILLDYYRDSGLENVEKDLDKKIEEIFEVFGENTKYIKTKGNLFLFDEGNIEMNDEIKSDLEMFKNEPDILYIRKNLEGSFSWVHLNKIMSDENMRLNLGLKNPESFKIEKEKQLIDEQKLVYIGNNKYYLDFNDEFEELKGHEDEIEKNIEDCKNSETRLNKTIQALSTQFGLLNAEVVEIGNNRFLYDSSLFDINDIKGDLEKLDKEDDVITVFKTGDNEYRCNYMNMLWRIKMHHDLIQLARMHQMGNAPNQNLVN